MVVNTTSISLEKNKNILFVYDRLDIIGGLETRWIDEFHYLKKNGYQVFFLTDKERFDSKISKLFIIDKFITVDSVNITIASDFIKLINQITHTVRNENITVISIHMLDKYACAAVIAAQICRIPVISTIHGTPDIYRKPIERIFFQQLVGRSFSLSISVSQHLKSIFKSQAPLVHVVPNFINLKKYKHHSTNLKPAWLVVNRISPEKYPSILRFLQAANECQIPTIDIVGRGNISELSKYIDNLGIQIQVNFLGEIEDIANLIPHYSGVAGMGRVAIEGLACQKPVCIISPEGNLIGLVTKDNFQHLKNYNFIGKTLSPISNQMFSEQLHTHTFKNSQDIYQQLKCELSTDNWNKYIKLYEKAEFIDNKALEALYYKLDFFATTLSKPFLEDVFFQSLLCETLIEYELDDILELFLYYDKSHGLRSCYPNPLSANKQPKKRNWLKFK